MKSSLTNMVLVLFLITAIASAAVGGVFMLTEEPIAQAKLQKKLNALSLVLPEFDNQPTEDTVRVEHAGKSVMVYTAKKSGTVVGYAIETSAPGFAAEIKLMTGFDAAGNIVNIEVLEQSETPGLGAKLKDTDNPVVKSIVGRNPAEMKLSVRKDGGDVDAITASTISSRAYIVAVRQAFEVFKGIGAAGQGGDETNGRVGAACNDKCICVEADNCACDGEYCCCANDGCSCDYAGSGECDDCNGCDACGCEGQKINGKEGSDE